MNPKIFKEYDIRGLYPKEIDEKTAYALGRAFVVSQKAKTVAIARDRRLESAAILPAVMSGVKDAGGKIVDLGIHSTPAMFFAVGDKNLDGGIVLTASHNPVGYTGLKMCNKNGWLLGTSTGGLKIAELAEKIPEQKSKKNTVIKTTAIDVCEDYWRFANSMVDLKKIKGFKLVLDASSGSGARLADYFFVRLHSKIIKINFKANDKYQDHGPNPMLKENRTSAIAIVKKTKADLAIIWDGDGDRCIFVDDRGDFVPPYYINCLLSQIFLQKYKKAKIAVDARLTVGISEVIKTAGGQPIVSRAGYANLVKLMHQKKLLFGCENSGHYFFNFKLKDKQKNFVFGDAIIPILMVLEYLQENKLKLSAAIKPLINKYPTTEEINIKNVDFAKLEKNLEKIYQNEAIEKIDGLSVYGDGWFFNIRPSKTEPLVRLNIETKNKKDLAMIKNKILGIIG